MSDDAAARLEHAKVDAARVLRAVQETPTALSWLGELALSGVVRSLRNLEISVQILDRELAKGEANADAAAAARVRTLLADLLPDSPERKQDARTT
jgi:hypothetical protein